MNPSGILHRKLPRRVMLSTIALAFFSSQLPASAATREPLYGAYSYDPLGRKLSTYLLPCEDSYRQGKHLQSEQCFRSLLESSHPLLQAEAFWALDDLQSANNAMRAAQQEHPDSALVRSRWGDLFMQTYQYQQAFNLYNEALTLDATYPPAYYGRVRSLQAGGGEPELLQSSLLTLNQLKLNPELSLHLRLEEVRIALEGDMYDEATIALANARDFAEQESLSLLEVISLEAVLAFMRFEDPQPIIYKALALNPTWAEGWVELGHFAEITRRYRQEYTFLKNAVTLNPNHWQAWLDLGQTALRLNLVEEANEAIKRSYAGDAFNPRTINLLRLLDTFNNTMVVSAYPQPPQAGSPELELRLDKEEKAVLESYVADLALESIKVYKQRYRLQPKAPIVVELFPKHEDFVVRSVGMPGVGILGVTFGYLFAMDSPSAHVKEDYYHWGTTLWHEMAHVFTLEVSEHLVPRWFSEGISVWEEWNSGPVRGRKIPLSVYKAMAEDKFLSVSELDNGFMRPSYQDQVIVSYMQAGLIFDFIGDYLGENAEEKIVTMLYAFKEGATSNQVLSHATGMTIPEFDAAFKSWITSEYGDFLEQLPKWQGEVEEGLQALKEERWAAAAASAMKALSIHDKYTEPNSPWLILARAQEKLGQTKLQCDSLLRYWQEGGYATQPLLQLTRLLLDGNSPEAVTTAIQVMQELRLADPFNADLHQILGDLYLEQNQPLLAESEFSVLLALSKQTGGPRDLAPIHLNLAKVAIALNDLTKSMDQVMTALTIAPSYRPAQKLLLELSRLQTENSSNRGTSND